MKLNGMGNAQDGAAGDGNGGKHEMEIGQNAWWSVPRSLKHGTLKRRERRSCAADGAIGW